MVSASYNYTYVLKQFGETRGLMIKLFGEFALALKQNHANKMIYKNIYIAEAFIN